ncbi:hypothetical protein [uncultured Gammaproteobacteria bacterium]|nr:hypothetical protein [uncultured Gammaproteobacteria bacterium]
MKKIIKTSVCITAIVLSLNAKTEDKHIPEKTGDGHITVQTSTMGLGIEYNYPVNSVLSIGFGVNQFNMSKTLTKNEAHYRAAVNFQSASIISNYHPWSNGFRLRAGAYYNNNKINLSAKSTGSITIGDTRFTNAEISINGEFSFKKVAPYIGIGYGSEPIGDNTFSLDVDIGVMQSPVQVQLIGTCKVATPAESTICQEFNSSLAKEEATLKEGAGRFKLYPVVSLGLSYRF